MTCRRTLCPLVWASLSASLPTTVYLPGRTWPGGSDSFGRGLAFWCICTSSFSSFRRLGCWISFSWSFWMPLRLVLFRSAPRLVHKHYLSVLAWPIAACHWYPLIWRPSSSECLCTCLSQSNSFECRPESGEWCPSAIAVRLSLHRWGYPRLRLRFAGRWAVDRGRSSIQDNPALPWHLKLHHRVHKSSTSVPTLSRINPYPANVEHMVSS